MMARGLAAAEGGATALAEAFLTARTMEEIRAEMVADERLAEEARAILQAEPAMEPEPAPAAEPVAAQTAPIEETHSAAQPPASSASGDPTCLVCGTRMSQAGPRCNNPAWGDKGCRYPSLPEEEASTENSGEFLLRI